MKELIKRYLESGISRRDFLSALTALGITSAAANGMAQSLSPFLAQVRDSGDAKLPSWMREVRGTGAALLVAQLKAAGIQHIFFNPAAGAAPIYDALVDEPDLVLIKALQEGSLAAMADGYAKASGKIPFVLCSRPGIPNCMSQIFNSYKDQIPMLIGADFVATDNRAHDGFEDADNLDRITEPITKWHWVAEKSEKIPDLTRMAIKFATTAPCGPVFVGYPDDTLRGEGDALIMDQSKFTVSMKVRPDASQIEDAARLLLEARNPLLYAGDEVTWCGAQKQLVELAELLGLPVAKPASTMGWSRPFPSRNPLFLGDYHAEMRYPGPVDVLLNLGARMPNGGARPRMSFSTKLIEIRLDPVNLARGYPTEIAMIADLKLAIEDLLAALRSQASASKLKEIGAARANRTAVYTAAQRQTRQSIARSRWDRSPLSAYRLGMELEQGLDKDTCFVAELDSAREIEFLMNVGGDDKQFFSNSGRVLGWGVPAAIGVKLAKPDLPVVAAVGDGAFLFGGPQPLWTMARYKVPATIIVMDNRAYDEERNVMFEGGGRQVQTGKDMACYLGDPDIDFAKAAAAFGVEGEIVEQAPDFAAALQRAKRANIEGRPYLLDVLIERGGLGAASTWYPPHSVADLRKRKV
jgi:thiamine pyrophosphate-dependent acetolactate synthase large subunit-like protein